MSPQRLDLAGGPKYALQNTMHAPLEALLVAQQACLIAICLAVLPERALQNASMASPPASQACVHASDFQGSLMLGSCSSSAVAGAESNVRLLSGGTDSLRTRFGEVVLRHWEDGPAPVTGDTNEGLAAGTVAHADRSVATKRT